MTDEVLHQANALKARIKEINSLLKQIEPTNTATGEERTAPVCIQAGLNSPVQFYLSEDVMHPLYDIDKAVYKQLVDMLKAYKQHAEEAYANLHD